MDNALILAIPLLVLILGGIVLLYLRINRSQGPDLAGPLQARLEQALADRAAALEQARLHGIEVEKAMAARDAAIAAKELELGRRVEAEREAALARQKLVDFEQLKQQMTEAAKAATLESGKQLSGQLLEQHKREAEAAKQQQEAAIKAALTENRKEIFDDGVSHVAGNPKGDVTLVEFFDYRCGYCKQVQPSVLALLKEDSRLRVVLKELPVLGPDSVVAARAAIAAQQQPGKYFAFHNAMMEHRGQLPEAEVLRIAKASGLDVAKLKADMAAPRVTEVIERNLALATKLGIQGTPGFVIGDEIVPGAIPLEAMRQLVKRQRGG